VRYKPGSCLLTGLDADGHAPVFMITEHIVIRDKNVWFVGEKLVSGDFVTHCHAWSVRRHCPRQLTRLNYRDITYHVPLTMNRVNYGCSEECLIALRYRI